MKFRSTLFVDILTSIAVVRLPVFMLINTGLAGSLALYKVAAHVIKIASVDRNQTGMKM